MCRASCSLPPRWEDHWQQVIRLLHEGGVASLDGGQARAGLVELAARREGGRGASSVAFSPCGKSIGGGCIRRRQRGVGGVGGVGRAGISWSGAGGWGCQTLLQVEEGAGLEWSPSSSTARLIEAGRDQFRLAGARVGWVGVVSWDGAYASACAHAPST